MQTREQQYAAKIYDQVMLIKGNPQIDAKKYGGMAHKLPVLIRSAGLTQALAFVKARGSKDGSHRLLDDLAQVTISAPGNELLRRSREAEIHEYMRLTQQVLDALLWYKRFAQSVLDVQAGEGEEDERDG